MKDEKCPFEDVKITGSFTIEKSGEPPVTISKEEIFEGDSDRIFLIRLKGFLRSGIFGILRELDMTDYEEEVRW